MEEKGTPRAAPTLQRKVKEDITEEQSTGVRTLREERCALQETASSVRSQPPAARQACSRRPPGSKGLVLSNPFLPHRTPSTWWPKTLQLPPRTQTYLQFSTLGCEALREPPQPASPPASCYSLPPRGIPHRGEPVTLGSHWGSARWTCSRRRALPPLPGPRGHPSPASQSAKATSSCTWGVGLLLKCRLLQPPSTASKPARACLQGPGWGHSHHHTQNP